MWRVMEFGSNYAWGCCGSEVMAKPKLVPMMSMTKAVMMAMPSDVSWTPACAASASDDVGVHADAVCPGR